MGAAEITRFLSRLATTQRVSASTQNQALAALLFLYRQVLEQDVPWLDDVVRAKRGTHVPVVMSRLETEAVLTELRGMPQLMAVLMYGAGLRLLECASAASEGRRLRAPSARDPSGQGRSRSHVGLAGARA